MIRGIGRGRRGPDPFLDWKVRLFFAGAALMAAGVVSKRDVLVLLAILVLALGALTITILDRRRTKAAGVEEEGDAEPEEDAEPPERPSRSE